MGTERSLQCAAAVLAAGVGVLAPDFARAHHVMDEAVPSTFLQGLLSGFGHPIIGLDHFVFLLAAGLLAALARKPFTLPAAFIAAGVAGTSIHVARLGLPGSELLVAVSVIVAGALLALRARLPDPALFTVFAGFGFFHGYAYGESIVGAEPTPLVAYLAGLALIQYAIVLAVARALDAFTARSERRLAVTARWSGVAVAGVGLIFFALNLA